MRSNQGAYDRGTTTFSPDGRLYQVEYAREAVTRGAPAVGVQTAHGVVLVTESRAPSPLLAPDSVEKLHDIDGRLVAGTAGHVADGRRLVDYARQYAQQERLRYGEPPGADPVATALADYVQESTQTGGTRPFGTALLLGGVDEKPRLYELDPSGLARQWHATAVGSDSEAIRASLESAYAANLDEPAGLRVALQALADNRETELSADAVDIATIGTDGVEQFPPARRARALTDAGLT